MAKIKLVTWNINSIRARIDQVGKLIEGDNPDVICFQETKVQDHMFPTEYFEERGFCHQAIAGQKSYNGVAIMSRVPLENITRRDWCAKGDARHIEARLPGGVTVHNFYVPAGGEVPDADVNDKFAHKLDFLDEMTDWSRDLPKDSKYILVGDLNIAPLESDVWSHKKLLKVISHTPLECEKMRVLMQAHDWCDVMRHFVPEPERLYSWWSYRAKDWRASDKGRRLDHIWASPDLKYHMKNMAILEHARDWEKPSDHAPVMVEFTI
ncbi:Exodeoxyribonuclease III [hydrothermal vent metagenome]|uniref:Exodeoxyribonuclease III n=1 Tax=hydrothermal vent metagenome TaxID=652676 RepID=A0A3B1B1E9_9ZZZZ